MEKEINSDVKLHLIGTTTFFTRSRFTPEGEDRITIGRLIVDYLDHCHAFLRSLEFDTNSENPVDDPQRIAIGLRFCFRFSLQVESVYFNEHNYN